MENIAQLCRVCLQRHSVRQNLYENSTLYEKFLYIGGYLETASAYVIPQFICSNCTELLEIAYQFVTKVKLSNVRIKQHNYRTGINLCHESNSNDFDIIHTQGRRTGQLFTPQMMGPKKMMKPAKRQETTFSNNQCHLCNKYFSSKNNLKRHIREHQGRRYICEMCSALFTQRSSLKAHLMSHNGINPYKCELCCKSFRQKKSYYYHCKIHSGERPYSCSNCDRSFIQKSNMKRHSQKCIKVKSKEFQCMLCRKYLATKQSLQRHFKSQHIENNNFILNDV